MICPGSEMSSWLLLICSDGFKVIKQFLITHNFMDMLITCQLNTESIKRFLFQLILFLKGYNESNQRKLAIITGVFLATGFCSAKVLSSLFEDHLVKDGKIMSNMISNSSVLFSKYDCYTFHL
jgi:ethanolamine transporter EutH